MDIMNISQVSLVEFKIEEILNKLRRVHKNYQFFVVLWETFANNLF